MKKNSGSYSMKTCDISGKRFKATDDNFYFNRNSADNFHPYSKKWDNVRRLGYIRDEKGMLQSPLMMVKRNSMEERSDRRGLDVNRSLADNRLVFHLCP